MPLRPARLCLAVALWAGCAALATSAGAAGPASDAGPTPLRPVRVETKRIDGSPPSMPVSTASPAPAAAPAGASSEAQRFCQNVAAAAADARFALETRQLNELQGQIAKRVADLEAKEAELKDVLARHDEAAKRAAATLVGIYAKMRPDAAAQQITALDDATAAAVLAGLNARQSSAILNEISPDRAVKLVNAISGLVPPDGKKS